jgi:hypothetical protein
MASLRSIGIVLLLGCSTVAPYERETLASSRMRIDGDPDESMLERARLRAREEGHLTGATSGGGGGGCGCN